MLPVEPLLHATRYWHGHGDCYGFVGTSATSTGFVAVGEFRGPDAADDMDWYHLSDGTSAETHDAVCRAVRDRILASIDPVLALRLASDPENPLSKESWA